SNFESVLSKVMLAELAVSSRGVFEAIHAADFDVERRIADEAIERMERPGAWLTVVNEDLRPLAGFWDRLQTELHPLRISDAAVLSHDLERFVQTWGRCEHERKIQSFGGERARSGCNVVSMSIDRDICAEALD